MEIKHEGYHTKIQYFANEHNEKYWWSSKFHLQPFMGYFLSNNTECKDNNNDICMIW